MYADAALELDVYDQWHLACAREAPFPCTEKPGNIGCRNCDCPGKGRRLCLANPELIAKNIQASPHEQPRYELKEDFNKELPRGTLVNGNVLRTIYETLHGEA